MKLYDVSDEGYYKIINFGNLTKEDILSFYEQGIMEEERIRINKNIKSIKKVFLFYVDDVMYSFNAKVAREIEVEKVHE